MVLDFLSLQGCSQFPSHLLLLGDVDSSSPQTQVATGCVEDCGVLPWLVALKRLSGLLQLKISTTNV